MAGEALLWRFVMTVILGFLLAGAAAGQSPEILLQEMKLELEPGTLQNHRIDLGRALAAGVVYSAKLEQGSWEGSRLELGFFDPAEARRPLAVQPEAEARRGEELLLRVIAGRCCSAMDHTTGIRLEPRSKVRGKRALPVFLPISLKVKTSEAAAAECRSQTPVALLRAALWGTLALAVHGMFANSRFIDRRNLALRLKPLRWNDKRRQHEEDKQAEAVQTMVYRELRFLPRALNWLRANPLAFGLLPGRVYRETVELILLPTPEASRLILVPRSDLYGDLEKEPDLGRGRLFVMARGDRFFGVPQNNRLGNMILEKSARRPAEREGRIEIGREEKLLYPGEPAGLMRSGWKMV